MNIDLVHVVGRYAARSDRFETVIADAPVEAWSAPSPCPDWTARDIVRHVLAMHAAMLRPLRADLSPAPSVDEDPLGAFRSARCDLATALTDRHLGWTTVATPVGPMPLADHIDQVASADLVIHAWDLARATGQDHVIDGEEVKRAWPLAQSMDDRMRIPDAFGPGIVVYGPEVEVSETASLQDRLLGLLGRDPRWQASQPVGDTAA